MNDLISRQAAIDELSQRYIIMDNPHYIGYNAGLDEAQKVIKALPPVQPKRGKWIERGTWSEGEGMGETYGKYWACNQCGRKVKGDWDECGKNFCDNCGADMRGGRKSETD